MSDGWPCGKCKASNHPEDRFCGECGAPHHEPEPEANPSAHSTITGILAELKEKPAGALEGVPAVLITGLVAAAVFGAACHFVARSLFDLPIIFPLLLGVAVGWSLKAAATRSRCRRPAVLISIALVAGVAAFGVRQGLETLKTRNEVREFLAQHPGELVQFGFFDALKGRAQAGIGISSRRTSQKSLTGAGFWILMLVETCIVAGVAAASAHAFSRLPYCGRCRELVPSVPVFRVNGRDAGRLTHFIRHQKWKEAQEMTNRASATATDRAEAILLKCGGCNGSSIRVDLYEGRRSKRVMHAALPPESLEALAKSA